MSQIISVTQKSRPNLFEEGVSVYSSSVEETTVPRRKKQKVQLGLVNGESDILQILIDDGVEQNVLEDYNEDYLPDLTRRLCTGKWRCFHTLKRALNAINWNQEHSISPIYSQTFEIRY